jgi:hypothetical protein
MCIRDSGEVISAELEMNRTFGIDPGAARHHDLHTGPAPDIS